MRSLRPEVWHERRVEVICPRKAGRAYDAIAAQSRLRRTGALDICIWHRQVRAKSLRRVPSGCRGGKGWVLNLTQELLVRYLIADKKPDQLKVPYALFMRCAVGELGRQCFGINLSAHGVGVYLKPWSFPSQNPMKSAYEQTPTALKKWLKQVYPAIAACAKSEGREIHRGNKNRLRSDDSRSRSHGPVVQTPVVRVNKKCQNPSVISTHTIKDWMRWKIF